MIRRARLRLLIGLVLAVGGFVAISIGGSRADSAAADLVRLPSGCTTTVTVSESGTYSIYYENKGAVADIGNCSNDDRAYSLAAPTADRSDPAWSTGVTVVDDAGRTIDAHVADGSTLTRYRTPTYHGTLWGTIELTSGTRYTFTIDAADQIGRAHV